MPTWKKPKKLKSWPPHKKNMIMYPLNSNKTHGHNEIELGTNGYFQKITIENRLLKQFKIKFQENALKNLTSPI
ncbi:MAG: hypothetical protein DRJ05_06600 [Bacteroidetes bacterium]|nr:MAG: hypothetical protein DRJ05_06600 [Bacteroidota bacterium]